MLRDSNMGKGAEVKRAEAFPPLRLFLIVHKSLTLTLMVVVLTVFRYSYQSMHTLVWPLWVSIEILLPPHNISSNDLSPTRNDQRVQADLVLRLGKIYLVLMVALVSN